MNHTHGKDLPGINRYALVVEPTEAYAEWARTCPGSASEEVLSELDEEGGTVYLIPEEEEDFQVCLQRNYRAMFEHELWSWCTDEAFWPKDRSFNTFKVFFKVRFHSMLLDMGKTPIEIDSYP